MFSQSYFDAWQLTASSRPDTLFYAYTKSIPYWIARQDEIQPNFVLTASMGGRHDLLALQYDLRTATVVYSEAEAEALGLEIDHDDSLAMHPGPSFALLLHGTQPKGTVAAEAWSVIRKAGGGYRKRLKVAK
jgi:hypothetical protein